MTRRLNDDRTVLTHEQRLSHLIHNDERMMALLRAVRDCNPPDWLVGAGIIRNLVWDHLHAYATPTLARDVDVAFFDPDDLTPERDTVVTNNLKSRHPAVNWEATNQAAVHLWYADHFGKAVPPFTSCAEAISTWPETATCTAVRLLPTDDLLIVAPFGLDDLFSMTLRRNPARVTVAQFRQRCREKRILEKWPQVTIVDG